MKTQNTLLALALSPLCLAAMPAGAVDLLHHGVPNVPASRIVGLWTTQAGVRPCGSSLPLSPARNTILFNAGGTVVANLESPIGGGYPNLAGIPGIHERGPDLGTWSFNPLTHQYTIKMRFDWYVDGVYHGYSMVDRTIKGSRWLVPNVVMKLLSIFSSSASICLRYVSDDRPAP